MAQSEFDRKIEVITGILADLTVKHQLSEEHMKDWDERMDRAERRMTRVENVLKLAIRAGRRERREWREKYAALVDAQMRSEAKLERTEETVNRLAKAGALGQKVEAFMDAIRQTLSAGARGEWEKRRTRMPRERWEIERGSAPV